MKNHDEIKPNTGKSSSNTYTGSMHGNLLKGDKIKPTDKSDDKTRIALPQESVNKNLGIPELPKDNDTPISDKGDDKTRIALPQERVNMALGIQALPKDNDTRISNKGDDKTRIALPQERVNKALGIQALPKDNNTHVSNKGDDKTLIALPQEANTKLIANLSHTDELRQTQCVEGTPPNIIEKHYADIHSKETNISCNTTETTSCNNVSAQADKISNIEDNGNNIAILETSEEKATTSTESISTTITPPATTEETFPVASASLGSTQSQENKAQETNFTSFVEKENEKSNAIIEKTSEFLLNNFKFVAIKGTAFLWKGNLLHKLDYDSFNVLIRSQCPEACKPKLRKSTIFEIIDAIVHTPRIQVVSDFFKIPEYLMNFENGIYNVSNGLFIQNSFRHGFTCGINARYNPDANSGYNFTKILDIITNQDELLQQQLQELTGLMISNYTYRGITIIIDPNDPTRGVFPDIITHLIGSEYVSSVPLGDLGVDFKLAELSTKVANIFNNLSPLKIQNIEKILTVTNSDRLSIAFKKSESFSHKFLTKQLYTGKEMPKVQKHEKMEEFFNMLNFIVLPTIPYFQRDPELEEEIVYYDSAFIAQWAIKGLQRLKSNNFEFTQTTESIYYKQNYISQHNNVIAFVHEKCEIAENLSVHSRVLYPSYEKFCRENSLKAVKQREFRSAILAINGVYPHKFRLSAAPYAGFIGIDLRDDSN